MAPQPHPRAVRYVHSRRSVIILALWLAAAALIGCSRKKTLDRNELRSEIRSAYSFVAESEMLIDYIRQGHATHLYAKGHAKELEAAVPQPSTQSIVSDCRSDMEMLCRELSGIAANVGDNDALAAARKRIENIRNSLQKAYSSI
jgi:hypothetical protein